MRPDRDLLYLGLIVGSLIALEGLLVVQIVWCLYAALTCLLTLWIDQADARREEQELLQ